MYRKGEHALKVVIGQVRSEQANRGQRQRSVRKPLEDDGELSRSARRLDAIVGGPFAEIQDVGAVNKHRGAALREVQVTIFDLYEAPHQRRRRRALARGEPLRSLQQFHVRE